MAVVLCLKEEEEKKNSGELMIEAIKVPFNLIVHILLFNCLARAYQSIGSKKKKI